MDGFQMLRALKKPGSGFASLKVFVVSALTETEIAQQGGLPDGVHYFQKPINYANLQGMVQKLHSDRVERQLSAA
jgi:CheY-like chemotaxis protein